MLASCVSQSETSGRSEAAIVGDAISMHTESAYRNTDNAAFVADLAIGLFTVPPVGDKMICRFSWQAMHMATGRVDYVGQIIAADPRQVQRRSVGSHANRVLAQFLHESLASGIASGPMVENEAADLVGNLSWNLK